MTQCKNCGAAMNDSFCPKCGQKGDVHRFTVKSILHNFFHAFTHVDSGLLYLIKELTLRPGNTVRDYIEGRRKKYFNPFQYYILTTAAIVFLTIKFDLGTLMIADIKYTGDFEEFRRQFIAFLYQYFNILQFITLPLLSLLTYIFLNAQVIITPKTLY